MEPKVSVGILWNEKISFALNTNYLCQGEIVSSENSAQLKGNQILQYVPFYFSFFLP